MRSLNALALVLPLVGCLVNTELYEELSDQIEPEEEPGIDADNDGWFADQDCDDDDPDVHPEADEVCNGIDDDCDDAVDVDALDAGTWYTDADGDGFGGDDAIQACEQPSDTVTEGGDCHDDDPTAFPGSPAPEFSDDDIDQDCDGYAGCTDLNCDDLPDLVIPSQLIEGAQSDVSPVWYGTGDLLGEDPHLNLPSMGAVGAVVDDFERDGFQDLVLVGYVYEESYDLRASVYTGAADGLDASRRVEVDTTSALDATSADLDQDGYPDLIVTSGTVGSGEATIYWGSAEGLDNLARSALPTTGSQRVVVSDLNSDGWEDLVFVSFASQRGLETRSSVYWNRAGVFADKDFSTLPSWGAVDAVCVDLDLDGYQEIVVANYGEVGNFELTVTIHHGSAEGYSDAEMTEIDALGAIAVDSADLNQDGWPDLVVVHNSSDSSTQLDSVVYWGSADGVTGLDTTPLPTRAARDVAIADLDQDGWLDLTFANYNGPDGVSTTSSIYWGSEDGFSEVGVTELPTVGAYRVLAGDVDLDGWLDLLFTQYTSGTSHETQSYLYYGSVGGFSVEHRESLWVDGPWGPPVLVGAWSSDDARGAR